MTDPKYTPGLAELAEVTKEAGVKAAIPINIQGGSIDFDLSPGIKPLGPSFISYIFDSSGGSTGLQTLRALSKEVKILLHTKLQEIKEECSFKENLRE